MPQLGLFPLNLVLFPEAAYPLHIFEDRYKALVGEAIESGAPFGINLVEGGKMFQVGCRVTVSRVIKRYPDGRLDVLVSGTTRYTVLKIEETESPYIEAAIEDFEDKERDPEREILEHAIRLYNELIDNVYGETLDKLKIEDWLRRQASFKIAQKSGLDLLLRQQLLEMQSESERLSFLTRHLEKVLPKIRKAHEIRKLSRNDGYYQP